jgi:ribosomal protein S18 acetylase RimI-like enzyme
MKMQELAALGIVELELAANEAWPAPVQQRLGEWLLRAADGWTGRGNSALPIGDPGLPLAAAIDAVRVWYTARGLPPTINVPLPLTEPVNAALAARGWPANPRVLFQTAPVATLLAALRPANDTDVHLVTGASPAALGMIAGRKGGLPGAAGHILSAVPQARFAELYGDSGELLAIARGTLTGDGRYFGIFLVEVVPAARQRGLAQLVIGALSTWAADNGAQTAFLQVEERNTAAVALYRRLGFTTHHTYLTRSARPH